MYTIVLSGPGGFEKQARRALVDAGLEVHEKVVGHGLAAKVDGGADPTVAFVSCEGDDVDAAVRAVESLRWALRAHYPAAAEPPLSPDGWLAWPPAAMPGESTEDLIRRVVREEMAKGAG